MSRQMSVPPNSPLRGAAAAYAQPLGEDDFHGVEELVNQVQEINCRSANRCSDGIIYRSGEEDQDIRQHVFRWDWTPYQEVFTNGFKAWRENDTPSPTHFSLNHYVQDAGRRLELTRPATHAFISTTLDSSWRPRLTLQRGEGGLVYRYEINAPGGIWVSQTLDKLKQYQDEVCFIGAIARQYIRSAQVFQFTCEPGSRIQTWETEDATLRLNANFNPQSHPYRELQLWLPVAERKFQNDERELLIKQKIDPVQLDDAHARVERQDSNAIYDWYANGVEDIQTYINAAFLARNVNEAYLFMKNEYVLVNYGRGGVIKDGPHLICDKFTSLQGTAFGEYGIDCAFDTDGTEAFIFSGKLCAYIDYASGSTSDKILEGPKTITAMFPFFKDTVFENGIDAAFRSTASNKAYIFKNNRYAVINYKSKDEINICDINQGFHSLRDTIFESGIEAAFASHRTNEAYIFKGEHCARIKFAPDSTDNRILDGVKKIHDFSTGLAQLLPRNNRGLKSLITTELIPTRMSRKNRMKFKNAILK